MERKAGIGAAIKRAREKRGWTSYRLAKNAGMSAVYLRSIEESEGGRPGVEIVARIAHALDLSTDALLAEAGIIPALDEGELPTLETYLRIAMGLTDEQIEHVRRTLVALDAERRLAEREVAESEENMPENMPDESDPMLERRAAEPKADYSTEETDDVGPKDEEP